MDRATSEPLPVAIRRAERRDVSALTELAHAAKRHWGYAESLIELWKPDLTVTVELVESELVYCAVADEAIVGFYAVSRDDERFELEHFWIDPRHMRAGIGARLFRHALATVGSLGGKSLEIASDPNAEGFYLRMGARPVGAVASQPAGRELPLLVADVPPRRQ